MNILGCIIGGIIGALLALAALMLACGVGTFVLRMML